MTFRKIELQQAMDDNAVAVTDLNLDGWLDMIFYNQFRRNISVVNGKPFQTQIEKNLPAVMKIEGIGGGFGYLAAADFNNDGFEDLVLGARDLLLFWNKEGKLRASTSSTGLTKKGMNVLDFVIADFDNDGWQDLVVLWEDGKAQVFRNRKGAGFENQTTVSGLDSSGSYQAITGGDYNRDGRIDLFLFSARESHYFENTGGWRNFAEVRLVGNQSNREGIGAKVELYSGGICQTRYCGLSQTGRNQSPSNLHFGLGKTNRIDSLKIFWPSGNRQDTFNLTSTGELLLREKGGYFFRDISSQLPTDSAGESKSSGAAFLDINNDGLSDIYVSNTGVNKLYHNLGDKNFSSVGRRAGVNNAGNGFGVCAADFDNDGWEDIFVSNSSNYPNAFYRNTGEGKYKNISHPSEIFELDQTFGVITADFNNNGFLDLYLSNADSNRFYLNRNNFVFREASEQTGTIHIGPNAAVAADYDNDGDMDIYLSCNMGDSPQEAERGYWPNRLLQNDGNAKFTDVGQFAGVDDSLNSKGACFGDYDNDGDLDLYVANDGTPNRLYQNNGDGTFQEVTAHAGVKLPIAAHTPAFIDFNNDGYLDLYVSGASYLPNNKLAAKADQPEKLYLNLRNGTFRDVSAISGIIQPACTPAAVWGDIDRDGDYDLFLANAFYKKVAPPWPANALYENISRRNRWIGFNLIGHQSNRSAIGAKLFLYTDSLLQMREVNGGYGFCSQSSKEIIFGLSGNMFISKVKIVWPSGTVQIVEDLASNQYYLVHEPVYFAFIQMPYQSRNRLLLIFFLTGISVIFLYVIKETVPRIKTLVVSRERKRKTIEKPAAAERVKTGSGPVNKILDLFSLEIKLLPYKNDYLLQHQINP
ncbi:MAG TPA: hypothetical protein ENK14_09950, partial [Caldithrix sp.]|nr:hypothetical protein [Caldithrix sp.]